MIQHKLRELNKKLDLLLDCNKKTAKDKLSEALNALEHENFHDAFEEFKKAGDKGWSVGQLVNLGFVLAFSANPITESIVKYKTLFYLVKCCNYAILIVLTPIPGDL